MTFRITDYSFWKYDQHKNFYQKMSSELVRNPPVPLDLKTLLQAYFFESNYAKQIALNTGWLCIFSNMYFG